MASCKYCSKEFEITDSDRKFYKKVDVPEPTHCPFCRHLRRLVQINQMNLFKRKCDGTGKEIITNYPPESPYKVYDQEYWFTDAHEGTDYGRDFDFNRPFFEQWHELNLEVPKPSKVTDYLNDENSEYTNYAGRNKNCYLIFDSDENHDCLYSFGMNGSRSSCDCYRVQNLELCFETVDSQNCYNCAFTFNSLNSTDCAFIYNCIGCKNCLMSCNLVQKEYHIFNKPVSKEEYEEFKKNMDSYEFLMQKVQEFEQYRLQFPYKFMRGFQNENVSGNHLVNCKNALNCFDSMKIWDGKYCSQVFISGKDMMDADECGEVELVYDSTSSGLNSYNLRFSLQCLEGNLDLTYANLCFNNCSHLFGCTGLKRKKFCILNKQYTEEEYNALVPKIIEHMKKTGEWGEFFPAWTSCFPYNLSIAQQYFPLDKEGALARGYKWRDDDPKEHLPQTYVIPDNISEVGDEICKEILACGGCGKNYKVTPQELKFYKQVNVPIPRYCFLCRHNRRLHGRTPRWLWDRNCDKCGAAIQTAYSPEQPETVYCEPCYLASVY